VLNNSIRILNFDDSILQQKRLLQQFKFNIVDFKDLGPQARYFSTFKTRNIIERRIRDSEKNSLTFLGSGDFHHISEILISRFDEPMSVIMFDFHPDWDTSPPRYGCGSWVTEVLKKKNNISKFILLGVSSSDLKSFGINRGYLAPLKDNRVEIYPYAHAPSRTFLKKVPQNVSVKVKRGIFFNTIYWQELKNKDFADFFQDLLKRIPRKDVYVSIDKDCLKNGSALTNWEEGRFSLEEFLLLLKLIKENLNIVGLDITGDYSPILVRGLFKRIASYLDHPKDIKAYHLDEASITALNEETNLKILKLISS
jgi:arginase family enzyme